MQMLLQFLEFIQYITLQYNSKVACYLEDVLHKKDLTNDGNESDYFDPEMAHYLWQKSLVEFMQRRLTYGWHDRDIHNIKPSEW